MSAVFSWIEAIQARATGFRRDELEFLPAAQGIIEAPASAFSRGIIYVLMALLMIIFLWSWIGKVDVVTVAQGRVVPSGRSKIVQAAETGKVKAIWVHEGDRVTAGQLLIELDPAEVEAEIARLKAEQAMMDMDDARLVAQLAGRNHLEALSHGTSSGDDVQLPLLESRLNEHAARLGAIDSEVRQRQAEEALIQANVNHLETILPLVEQRVDALRKLADKGAGPRLSALDAERERLEAEHALVAARERLREVVETRAALAQRRQQTEAEFRSGALSELSGVRRRQIDLEQQMIKMIAWRDRLQLRAPSDGTVQSIEVNSIGAVLGAGQSAAKIVPSNVPLLVEAWIENKDVGFLRKGQDVSIKIDAFDWTRYGVIKGTIVSISPEAIAPYETLQVPVVGSAAPMFTAHIQIDKSQMSIDGLSISLQPGMTASAEVKTGRRRILEFLINPVLQRVGEAARER